ncbi:DgyrCDS10843 [Dimorphilus gyrociliatus]|uniref:DgyrCDS10843 n=1 Tax=Dimorphilus gyrociliatus TaxID=2664684 RepID=A0A7I8W1K8_9ANNE|nr:DgyrCDS10843 [Dimorphilus gyrociliatus]
MENNQHTINEQLYAVETNKMMPNNEKREKKYIKIKQFKIPVFDVDGKPMMMNPSFSTIACGILLVFAGAMIFGLILVSFHRPYIARIREYNRINRLGSSSSDMLLYTRNSMDKAYLLTSAQAWFWHKGITLKVKLGDCKTNSSVMVEGRNLTEIYLGDIMESPSNNFRVNFPKDICILPKLNKIKPEYEYALVSVVNFGRQVNSRKEVDLDIFQTN